MTIDDRQDMTSGKLGRRNFLRSAAVLGVAGAAVSPWPVAWADDARSDVIVIGAGFAGVTAARDLAARGLRVRLLEARDRLGGRTFTEPFGGQNIEVGGTWIGSGQPFVWSELMKYRLAVKESAATKAEHAVWWDEGTRRVTPPEQYAEVYQPAAEAFYAPAAQAYPQPFLQAPQDPAGLDAMTAAQAVDALPLSDTQRQLMRSFAAINGHSPAERSSYLDQLRWYALAGHDLWRLWDNLSRYRIATGTPSLIARIAADARADIRLNTPVATIRQSDGQVAVNTVSGETFHARAVVLAIPMNCWADVAFEPGLSAIKLAASRQRHTGSGTKVYAQTTQRHPLFFGHGREEFPLCFAWTEYDGPDSQLLCGFGASSSLLDTADKAAVQAAFRRYRDDITVADLRSYDWNADPYAKGTWCMYPPGLLTQGLPELQRCEGQLFFAGADIATGWRGFIDGAIESGAAVAYDVSQHLA